MVTYWDASALVPLVLKEAMTGAYLRLAAQAGVVTWWGSYVECMAAINRHARQGTPLAEIAEAYRTLEELADDWIEIAANHELRRAARRALRTHHLRAGDALQLGAAMIASRFEPHRARFITYDARLRAAAEREGFQID